MPLKVGSEELNVTLDEQHEGSFVVRMEGGEEWRPRAEEFTSAQFDRLVAVKQLELLSELLASSKRTEELLRKLVERS